MKVLMMSGKLTKKDVMAFMLHHNYRHIGGMLTGILGLFGLVAGPIVYFLLKDLFITLILLAIGLMYVVMTPLDFYTKASRQLKTNPVFKNKMTFKLDDEGLLVQLYTGPVSLAWEEVQEIVVKKDVVLVYTDESHAFIIPVRFFACQDDLAILMEKATSLELDKPMKQRSSKQATTEKEVQQVEESAEAILEEEQVADEMADSIEQEENEE